MRTFITHNCSFHTSPTGRLVLSTHGHESRDYDCLKLFQGEETPKETKQLIVKAVNVLMGVEGCGAADTQSCLTHWQDVSKGEHNGAR